MKINATMIVLPVKDIEETIKYYEDNFEFQVSEMWPKENPSYILLSNGYNHLGFIKSEILVSNNEEISINFDVDNIDETYAKIKGNVKVVQELANAEYNRKEFSLLDCNGYKIIIGQYIEKVESK